MQHLIVLHKVSIFWLFRELCGVLNVPFLGLIVAI